MIKKHYRCLIERTVYGDANSWTLEQRNNTAIATGVTLSVTIQPSPQSTFELLLEPVGYNVSVQSFSTLGEALAYAARVFSIHKIDWLIMDSSPLTH